MSKIYTVKHSDGTKSLVRAETAKGAVRFKREQVVMDAEPASQDDLISLTIGGVTVEDATQAGAEDVKP
jgi:hypothetical protein